MTKINSLSVYRQIHLVDYKPIALYNISTFKLVEFILWRAVLTSYSSNRLAFVFIAFNAFDVWRKIQLIKEHEH